MDNILSQAIDIASNMSVATPPNGVVLYSISFLPSKENKEQAFAYLATHPKAMMIDQTECGQELIRLGLLDNHKDLTSEQIAYIWKIASQRMINEASGNIVAFVKHADARSVFRSTELPAILCNEQIKTINGIDKFEFAKEFTD